MVSKVCSRLELPDMNLDEIRRSMILVAMFRKSSNPSGLLRRGGSFGCANRLTHVNATGVGRNIVSGDVLYCATSRRCRIHEPTTQLCSVCGCVGRYRTALCSWTIVSMFFVWLWRVRWPLHDNGKSSQLPALRLRLCEYCAQQYGAGGSSAAKHAQHFTARGCSQLREHPAARPASNVTRMGMPILIFLCMILGQLLIFGRNSVQLATTCALCCQLRSVETLTHIVLDPPGSYKGCSHLPYPASLGFFSTEALHFGGATPRIGVKAGRAGSLPWGRNSFGGGFIVVVTVQRKLQLQILGMWMREF